jgi:hypothetical protein
VPFGRLSQNRGGTPIDVRLPLQARPWPKPRQTTVASVGVLFRYFFRSFPFGPSVIRAEAALANASTGIGLLPLSMEHRIKSVVTAQNSGVAQLGR